MKVAVVGCTHGELDAIYNYCVQGGADLVICCGDFQACRNATDLDSMASPKKYHEMKDFHKYYSGQSVAPIPTLFIGGNHEASTHLWELPFGGWAAPNIYYLGFSGVVKFGGYRIAGASGIKGGAYKSGHFERPPFQDQQLKSIYNYRQYELWKLSLLTPDSIDFFCSHEWPLGIGKYPGWTFNAEHSTVGFAPLMDLLEDIRPTYWFAGHMHHKMSIDVPHKAGSTLFRAFSKPQFGIDRAIGFFEFKTKKDEPFEFQHDLEWLAILKASFEPLAFTPANKLSVMQVCNRAKVETCKAAIQEKFKNNFAIPADQFVRTAPVYGDPAPFVPMVDFSYNPQTEQLLQKLELPLFFLSAPVSQGGRNARIQPDCRFGSQCTKPGCKFRH